MAVLLLATSLCGAQDVNAPVVEPPIIIDSDTNQYDLRTGVTRFSDNVTIQRGAMRVSADEGVVHQSDGRIALVELFGSPTTWRDRLDDGSIVEGQAAQIQFEVAENVVTLIGDARLQHQRGRFTGDELIYDLDTESLVGRGSSGNQARVILEGDSIRRERSDASPESEPADETSSSSATATEAAGGAASRSSTESESESGSESESESESDAESDAESESGSDAEDGRQDRATASDRDNAEERPVEPPVAP